MSLLLPELDPPWPPHVCLLTVLLERGKSMIRSKNVLLLLQSRLIDEGLQGSIGIRRECPMWGGGEGQQCACCFGLFAQTHKTKTPVGIYGN